MPDLSGLLPWPIPANSGIKSFAENIWVFFFVHKAICDLISDQIYEYLRDNMN